MSAQIMLVLVLVIVIATFANGVDLSLTFPVYSAGDSPGELKLLGNVSWDGLQDPGRTMRYYCNEIFYQQESNCRSIIDYFIGLAESAGGPSTPWTGYNGSFISNPERNYFDISTWGPANLNIDLEAVSGKHICDVLFLPRFTTNVEGVVKSVCTKYELPGIACNAMTFEIMQYQTALYFKPGGLTLRNMMSGMYLQMDLEFVHFALTVEDPITGKPSRYYYRSDTQFAVPMSCKLCTDFKLDRGHCMKILDHVDYQMKSYYGSAYAGQLWALQYVMAALQNIAAIRPSKASTANDLVIADFIEIGTSNFDTVTQHVADNDGFNGYAIEPSKHYLSALPARRGVQKVNAAIVTSEAIAEMNKRGEQTVDLYYIPEDVIDRLGLFTYLKGCNAIGDYHGAHHEPHLKPLVQIDKVPAFTMTAFLAKERIHRIRLLKIDAEGYDLPILEEVYAHMKQRAWPPLHVDRIMFESTYEFESERQQVLMNRFIDMGYRMIMTGEDTILENVKPLPRYSFIIRLKSGNRSDGINMVFVHNLDSVALPSASACEQNFRVLEWRTGQMELDADAQVKLTKISVSGNDRTRLSYFAAELEDLSRTGVSLKDSVHELSEKTNSLLSTGLFEAVDSNLTVKALEGGRFQAEVQINVKEKQIPTIETAAYVKSGTTSEVGAEFKAALRNPIGFGEVLKASTVASQTGREYTCQLSIPNVGPRRMNMNMIARSGVESQAYYTSFRQQINAVSVELRSRDDKHQFVYEYALRDEVPVSLSDIARNQGQDGKDDKSKPWDIFSLASLPASAVTVHTAAASLKTALRYNCTLLDTRDHPAAPSTGSYLQSSVEVAAPPGSTHFLRGELVGQHNVTLGPSLMGQPGLVASMAGSLGLVRPILAPQWALWATEADGQGTQGAAGSGDAGADKSSLKHGVLHLSDRFHLGGPNSLRGFGYCGTGPRAYRPDTPAVTSAAPGGADASQGSSTAVERTDSLGGDFRATFLAMLSIPVPVQMLAQSQVRAFAFVNAGMLSSLAGLGSNSSAFGLGALRASVGGGFSVAPGGPVRIEATYSVPLLSAPQDQRRGFQLGLSAMLG